jgi:hypothetical protein
VKTAAIPCDMAKEEHVTPCSVKPSEKFGRIDIW